MEQIPSSTEPKTKQLPLSKGLFAIIDECDFERCGQYKWTALTSPHTTYARRTIKLENGRQRTIYLHRFILDAPPEMEVDHRDRNGLNCVRSNLRTATGSNNQHNKGINKNNKSGFKGVSFNKRSQKWVATITFERHQMFLGYFETKEEAARAYELAARLHHKEFHRLR